MDMVLENWLERQYADGMSLCAASDVLTLVPGPGRLPPRRYLAQFDGPTLVRAGTGVSRADRVAVLLQFPPDYLRLARDTGQIVNLIAPVNLFHPNVKCPYICIGRIAPGTGLVELVYRLYEVLTFQRVTPREDDALDYEACAWARGHMHLFPLSTAPLRRRAGAFSVHEVLQPEASHE